MKQINKITDKTKIIIKIYFINISIQSLPTINYNNYFILAYILH